MKEGLDGAIDKPVQLANYFCTGEGKTLVYSITELTDFSMKTAVLFFPYENLMQRLTEYLRSKQIDEQILKSIDPTMSKGYRDLLADFLPRYDDLIGTGDINPPFLSKDSGRFLALHVMSLYSYIEVYVDEILNKLLEQEKLLKRMIKKIEAEEDAIIRLKDLSRYLDNQESALIRAVRRYLPRNLIAKIDFIVATVGIENELIRISETLDFTTYRGLLSKLIDLRNIFAHGEPCPEIFLLKDKFNDAPIEGIWKGFLRSLNIEPEGPFAKAGIHDLIMEFVVEQGPMFSMILTTTIIALMYPLIIDTAIFALLNIHRPKL